MFGTDITVEFDSSWAQNVIEKELTLDKMRAEASQLAEETEETGEPEESDDASQLAEEPEESDDASQLAGNPEINITIINGDNIEISDEDGKGDDESDEQVSTG